MSTTFSFIYWHTANTGNNIAGNEVECWVNNVNVALSSNGGIGYFVNRNGNISTITQDAYNKHNQYFANRTATKFTDGVTGTSQLTSSYNKSFILFLNAKYKLSDLQRVIWYNNMQFSGAYSQYYNRVITVFLLDNFFNIVGEFDHNYPNNFRNRTYINMIGPADTPNDPTIQYPVYTSSQTTFNLTSPSVNTLTFTNFQNYTFNEPDKYFFDFKFQPFDYTLENNENHSLIGAHKLYDLKIIKSGTFHQAAFVSNSYGTNVSKMTFTLREPSSNNSFLASSNNSGYFKINNSLNSVVLSDTNSPSSHPYYFKYGSSGNSASLFYKDTNGLPNLNNNFNILNEIGGTTTDNSHLFALSFESSLNENSLIIPINYTINFFESSSFRFISIFSNNVNYLSKKNLRHYNWNLEMEKMVNQLTNLNDGDDIYLYILEFGNRFHYLSSNTLSNKYLFCFNNNKVIDINGIDDNLELILYKEFISEKSDDYSLTEYPQDEYPTLMNELKHYPVTDVFHFNINNNDLTTDTSYILLEVGGTTVCKHIYMVNNTIFLQIINTQNGYNELFELGTYNSDLKTNVIITELNYLTSTSFNIKIYFNNLNIINKNVSVDSNGKLEFFGTNRGGIGNFVSSVHSSVSSFSSSIPYLNHANYYIFKNSYEEILSHNHIKYMKNKHNIENKKTTFDIQNDNIHFKIINKIVTNSGIIFDKEIIKSVDSSDLQMEYIANSLQSSRTWTSNYDTGHIGYEMNVNDQEWHFSSDENGYYYKKLNDSQTQLANNFDDVLFPNYKDISYNMLSTSNSSDSTDGFTFEAWIKLDDTGSTDRNYNIFGLKIDHNSETGEISPFFALNNQTIGGMGITPGAANNDTYSLMSRNPYYINESPNFGNLLHLIGYRKPDTGLTYERGIYKNGIKYTQPNINREINFYSFTISDYINNTTYFDVTKNGVQHTVNAPVSNWYTFTIISIDPTDADFYNKEYIIDWENDPIDDQHGGYYLDYDNTSHRTDSFIRVGGPIWHWYAGGEHWTPYEGANSIFVDQNFRTSHRMIFRFVNDTTYSVTYTYNGVSYTENISTVGGWTFSSKSSIQFSYKMYWGHITEYRITNNHNFNLTVNYTEPELKIGFDCKNLKLYSFRLWHRQLLHDEISFLYNQGPSYSTKSLIYTNDLIFEYMGSNLTTTSWLPTYIKGEDELNYSNNQILLDISYHDVNEDINLETNYLLFKSNNFNSTIFSSNDSIAEIFNNFETDLSQNGFMFEAWVLLEKEYNTSNNQDLNVISCGDKKLLLNNFVDSNGNIGMFENNISNNTNKFKYIWIQIRSDLDNSDPLQVHLVVQEIECYINGVNVALSSNGGSATFTKSNMNDTNDNPYFSNSQNSHPHPSSNAIDGDTSNLAHSTTLYHNILVTLSQEYSVKDLQRIIVYNRVSNPWNKRYGNMVEKISLLNSSNEIMGSFTHPTAFDSENIIYLNYIGPSITSLDSSKIFTSNNLDVSIVETNLVQKFKYIHFIVEPDTIHNEFWHIFEVQLWINNVNVALSSNGSTATFTSLTDITDTNDSPYTSLGADKAINNVIPTTSSNTDMAHSNGTYQNLLITLPEEYEIDDIQRMIVYNRINFLDHYEQTYRVRLLDRNKNTLSEINHYGDLFGGIKYINYIGNSDISSNTNYTIHNSDNRDYNFTSYQSDNPGSIVNMKEKYVHVVGYMLLNGDLNIDRGIYLNGVKYQQQII